MSAADERAAALLRAAFEAIEPMPDTPHARRAIVEAMQRAGAAPPARKAGQVWVAAAAVLIVMLGVALTTALRGRSTPTVVITEAPLHDGIIAMQGTTESPAVGAPWPTGTRLRTGVNGSLRVAIAKASLELAPGSEVERGPGPAYVRVLRGAVLAEVTVQAEALSLETSDVQVNSQQGRFSVSPAAGCRGATEVRVLSGKTNVTSSAGTVTLEAGDVWPSEAACGEPVHPPPPEPVLQRVTRPAPVPSVSRPETPPSPPADPLSRQNELYRLAQAAHSAGRSDEALSALDRLLEEYPTGALAETALLQKIRWLSQRSPEAARAAANDYLTQFPRGVGRAEAERAVLETP